MDQASRIIAASGLCAPEQANGAGVISRERIALGAWKRAVGRRLAGRTQAAKLVRGTLVVEVEDQVWRENLWSLRHHILRNLASAIGPGIVHALEFRVMPPRREPARENVSSAGPSLFDEADAIQDPGLRRIYKASRRRETA
jgi:predicted nucleic acid-binding Zn ribbon protein